MDDGELEVVVEEEETSGGFVMVGVGGSINLCFFSDFVVLSERRINRIGKLEAENCSSFTPGKRPKQRTEMSRMK